MAGVVINIIVDTLATYNPFMAELTVLLYSDIIFRIIPSYKSFLTVACNSKILLDNSKVGFSFIASLP
jgi:hypothetical protein